MMKISGLPINYFGKVSTESFLKQARDFESLDDNAMDVAAKIYECYASKIIHGWLNVQDSWINGLIKGIMKKYCTIIQNQSKDKKGVSDEIGI